MTANNGQFSWRSLVATGVVILIFAGLIALTRHAKCGHDQMPRMLPLLSNNPLHWQVQIV
jgi:hypothetical protein